MSSIDYAVNMSTPTSLESFTEMAKKIGLAGFATQEVEDGPIIMTDNGLSVLRRIDVSGRGLTSVKRQITKIRPKAMIVALPLTTVEIANWAAEDSKVDLLTLDPSRSNRFRESTARLAASSGTCLEIQFAPLLNLSGLNRSKIIKAFREGIETATGAGMSVVLSSGAKHPMHMRSAMAMRHIGLLLGMNPKLAETAVCKTPFDILERNQKRLSPEFVGEGVEIVQRSGNG
ncbi:MAG: RNase P subunit p30 family protein [Candidatus Thorarchaeota archaeon]